MIKQLFLALFFSISAFCAEKVINYQGSNGSLPKEKIISEVFFLMAHNAGTEDLLYSQQSKNIENLAKLGVRGFKIPMHLYSKKGLVGKALQITGLKKSSSEKPYIALCHEATSGNNCSGTIALRKGHSPKEMKAVFKELANVINKYKKEVFIVRLDSSIFGKNKTKNNGADTLSDNDIMSMFNKDLEESELAKYAYKFLENKVPSLDEMRQSDKRLIIIQDENNRPDSPYTNQKKLVLLQSKWSDAKRKDCPVDGLLTSPLFEVNINFEYSFNKDSFTQKLTSKIINKTSKDYRDVNSMTNSFERFEECKKSTKRVPNIIASDFVDKGNLIDLIDYLNNTY